MALQKTLLGALGLAVAFFGIAMILQASRSDDDGGRGTLLSSGAPAEATGDAPSEAEAGRSSSPAHQERADRAERQESVGEPSQGAPSRALPDSRNRPPAVTGSDPAQDEDAARSTTGDAASGAREAQRDELVAEIAAAFGQERQRRRVKQEPQPEPQQRREPPQPPSPTAWPRIPMVRFIRIKHRGSDWDDGLRAGDADANVLTRFARTHGVRKAENGEAYPVSMIVAMPQNKRPPFLYLTGDSLRMSAEEEAMLREYLTDGGLLFADAGSLRFDRDLEALLKRLFPKNPLKVIPNDDPLFRQPHVFRNGAPPLWHHGGKKVLGVRRDDRWSVVYHPGDINDVWKTGHSGVDKETVDQAYYFFENVLWYAHEKYPRGDRP